MSQDFRWFLMLGFALGCGDSGSPTDVGPTDVGPMDANPGDAGPPASAYTLEMRTLDVGGELRSFSIAYPESRPANVPLVFSLHGDSGSPGGMRAALPLEAEAASGAVFVYPAALGEAFEYWSYEGRTREADLVTALIASLGPEFGIDTDRVFIVGFSGGATMANAVACRLGADVIRGIAVHSGSLYATDGPDGPEFTTGPEGASCALPAAVVVWGMNDGGGGTDFGTSGVPTRDLYVDTASCEATSTPTADAPCVAYDGCDRPIQWCPIEGMGHSIWPRAAHVTWAFFDTLR